MSPLFELGLQKIVFENFCSENTFDLMNFVCFERPILARLFWPAYFGPATAGLLASADRFCVSS